MKKLLLLTMIMIAFVACKKETRIEKNLWSNGGKWNIVRMETTDDHSVSGKTDETIINPGTIQFNKGGSGTMIITTDGDTESSAFTYTNTENKLMLIINGSSRNFDLNWKKNTFDISITDEYDSSGEHIIHTEKLFCEKDK
jgi:hypothetical protein